MKRFLKAILAASSLALAPAAALADTASESIGLELLGPNNLPFDIFNAADGIDNDQLEPFVEELSLAQELRLDNACEPVTNGQQANYRHITFQFCVGYGDVQDRLEEAQGPGTNS